MGKFIFCIGNKAKLPYTFRSTGISVYTMEELCYYLYHNIDTLEEDLADIQLVNWIRSEWRRGPISFRSSSREVWA